MNIFIEVRIQSWTLISMVLEDPPDALKRYERYLLLKETKLSVWSFFFFPINMSSKLLAFDAVIQNRLWYNMVFRNMHAFLGDW